jgi:hypothetical protein
MTNPVIQRTGQPAHELREYLHLALLLNVMQLVKTIRINQLLPTMMDYGGYAETR